MDALAILVNDRRGQSELVHERGVRVACGAGVGDVGEVCSAVRVRFGQDVVASVAIDANGDALILRVAQSFSVPAGHVGRKLVGSQSVGVHPGDVGVTIAAQVHHSRARGFAAKGSPVIKVSRDRRVV